LQRLSYTRNVAVPEYAKATGEEPVLHAVAFDVLVGQEPHQRLRGS
jgi:hypothetical protein